MRPSTSLVDPLYDVPRPVSHFGIDTAYIFTNEPHGEKLDADKYEEDCEKREYTFDFRAYKQSSEEQEDTEYQPQERDQDPEAAYDLNGEEREPCDKIEVKLDQPAEVVL